jgi:hypothetical protein
MGALPGETLFVTRVPSGGKQLAVCQEICAELTTDYGVTTIPFGATEQVLAFAGRGL